MTEDTTSLATVYQDWDTYQQRLLQAVAPHVHSIRDLIAHMIGAPGGFTLFWARVMMSAGKMHVDEVDVDVALVGRLLAAQFPQWADLPIEPVHSAGTDNAIYRVGSDMAVRLPRIEGATGQVDKEHQWLPRLAPLLPLAIPVPLAKGTPGEGYPWHWSVYGWLAGENATIERIVDPGQAARDLAQFIAALQRIDPTGGPPPRTTPSAACRSPHETLTPAPQSPPWTACSIPAQ